MKKAQALYEHLLACVPELARDPAQLDMRLDSGTVVARLGDNLGYQITYRLTLTVLTYGGHLNTLLFPIMLWLRTNEPQLLQNYEKAEDGFRFEIDVLDRSHYDVAIDLPLTEAIDVLATGEPPRYEMRHRDEPALAGTEGTAGLAMLPDDVVLLLNAYGELLLNGGGGLLTRPVAPA